MTKFGAQIVGISGDRIENLRIFKKENNLNFTLLSDSSGSIAGKYGVPVGSGGSITCTVDHQKISLVRDVTTSRWTFIIDEKGKIVFINSKADPTTDSKKVLQTIIEYGKNSRK